MCLGDGGKAPGGVFVVTFDDGYENNYTDALPVLEELGVPATIFLATSFLDSTSPFPFDDSHRTRPVGNAGQRSLPLELSQCHKLLDSGLIELGTHTHTHQRFVGRIDAFREDMQASIELLHEQFGVRRPTFAFPHGLHDQPMLDVARDLGIRCALTTTPGLIDISSDPLGLRASASKAMTRPPRWPASWADGAAPLTHKLRSLGRSTIGRKSAAPLSGPPAPTHRCRRPPRWNRRPKKALVGCD